FDYFCNMEMVELSLVDDPADARELHGLFQRTTATLNPLLLQTFLMIGTMLSKISFRLCLLNTRKFVNSTKTSNRNSTINVTLLLNCVQFVYTKFVPSFVPKITDFYGFWRYTVE
ncbi:MAG: hypothetical protein K2K08_09150, partial [Paramuribaculum sp.]|nr:hypothetical protein [Paramuribaculum sp.]